LHNTRTDRSNIENIEFEKEKEKKLEREICCFGEKVGRKGAADGFYASWASWTLLYVSSPSATVASMARWRSLSGSAGASGSSKMGA